MTLADILYNSNYKLSQFSNEKIGQLEKNIFLKKDKKGNDIPYVQCGWIVWKDKDGQTLDEVYRKKLDS